MTEPSDVMRNTRQGPQGSEGSDILVTTTHGCCEGPPRANLKHKLKQEQIQERIQEKVRAEQERLQAEARAKQELLQDRLLAEIEASRVAMEEHVQVNEKLRKTNDELCKSLHQFAQRSTRE